MRYRGSLLGTVWSIINPLLMLAVYTFVFSVIFKARWNIEVESRIDFALILFCGLIPFNIFAETLSRAPTIVVGNPNYIKKVIFPLELLPLTALGTALINGIISALILVAAKWAVSGAIHLTIFYLPIVVFPLLLLTAGLAWFIASLGVYIRDINQIMPVIITALLFLSPIFYPVSVIPPKLKPLYLLNPIGYVVEDSRRVLLWGEHPDWVWLLAGSVTGAVAALGGYMWFQKTRRGFADVI
ncbi:MAG: ABC transporter permease [Candidatus Dadabacteria bacterium]|nr:MAG: ABC transporter permease [Candidatus Dadabacteria bacterium]